MTARILPFLKKVLQPRPTLKVTKTGGRIRIELKKP